MYVEHFSFETSVVSHIYMFSVLLNIVQKMRDDGRDEFDIKKQEEILQVLLSDQYQTYTLYTISKIFE